MSEGVAAIGLVLALEGALYALFPDAMKRFAMHMLDMPSDTLRLAGLVSAALGVGVVWMVRG